LNIVLENNQDK